MCEMTKEETIEEIKSWTPILLFSGQCTEKTSKAQDMAVSALSENTGEWIPVSRKLPDEEHEVYCQLSDGSNAVLYIQDNWGQMEWVDGMMGTGTYDVVAWREKPTPYKGKERNKE